MSDTTTTETHGSFNASIGVSRVRTLAQAWEGSEEFRFQCLNRREQGSNHRAEIESAQNVCVSMPQSA